MKAKSPSSFLYVAFRKDIGRKAMALILALILWVYLDKQVALNQPRELPVIPISEDEYLASQAELQTDAFFLIIPPDLMVMDLEESKIKVILSGPRNLLPERLIGVREIRVSELEDRLDMKLSISVVRDYFESLKDRRRVGMKSEPNVIRLRVARKDDVVVGLTVENVARVWDGDPAAVDGVVFNPTNLLVEGPAPEIEKIRSDPEKLKLEDIQLKSENHRDVTQTLRLHPDMLARKISIAGPDRFVSTTVNISEKQDELILKGVPVQIRFNGQVLTLQERERFIVEAGSGVQTIDYKFRGPITQIQRLRRELDETVLRTYVNPYVELNGQGKFASLKDVTEPAQYDLSGEVRDTFHGRFPDLEIIKPSTVIVKLDT